jgi:hypothetical protein
LTLLPAGGEHLDRLEAAVGEAARGIRHRDGRGLAVYQCDSALRRFLAAAWMTFAFRK